MSLGDVKIYSGLGSGSIDDFSGAWYTTFVTNLLADFQKFQQDVINNVTYSADLGSYALITYVDEAVANVTVDLTGYATITYVDEAVANVTVDLTGYATELYVTQALENFDLSAYATTQYVDAAIAALGFNNHTHEDLENRIAEIETELNPISDMVGVVADNFSAYGQDPHWYIIARLSKVDSESSGIAGPAVIRGTSNADRSDYFYNYDLMGSYFQPSDLASVEPVYNYRGKVLGGYAGSEYTVTIPTSQSVDHIYVSGGQLSAPYFTFSDGNGSDIDLASFEFEAGKSYTFTAAEGFTPHPFEIGSTPGTVSTYSSGGPLSAVGDSLVLDIPTSFDSSTESLYFYCTAHTSMNGQLTVVAAQPEVFLLNGTQYSNLDFFEGSTYVFDWSADLTKPLKLSTTQDGENNGGVEFTDGVVQDNEAGTTTITIPLGLGTDLYFYGDSPNMGGKLSVLNPLNTDYVDSSDKINSNLLDTLSSNRTTKTNKVLLIVDTCIPEDYQYWANYSIHYYYWKYVAQHKGITVEFPGIDGSLPVVNPISLYNGLNGGVGPTVNYAKFYNEFGGLINHKAWFQRYLTKDEWLSYLNQYDSVLFYAYNKFPFFSTNFINALVEYRDTGGGLYFNSGWRYYVRAINPLIYPFGAQYIGGKIHSRQTPTINNNTGLHDYSNSPGHTRVGYLKSSGYGLQSLWLGIDNEAHVYGGSNDPYLVADINTSSGADALNENKTFLDLVDTPNAFDPNKPYLRKVPDDEGGALEFVSSSFVVDAEYRAVMGHSLRHKDKQPVVVGEEFDITAISPHAVIWKNHNGFLRFFDARHEAGVNSRFDDVFIRIDTGEPQCSDGYTFNPDNNTCIPDAGGESIDPTYPNEPTFEGVYDPNKAANASGSYGYTAKIRVIKSGDYAGAWIDTHDLLERVSTLESTYAGIPVYTTSTLPGSEQNGTLAWNSTISELVYFLNDGWYRVSDNSLVKFTVIEAYIISGQSNAGGNGEIVNLSGYNQIDGTGTLADQRPFILFSNNYNTTGTDPSTALVNVEPAAMTPGTTTTSAPLHGMEISFMDSIRDKRTALPAGMKYFINGAEIGKFDKATSDAETSSGTTNGWDGLTQSIDALETWFNDNGYQFSWKGFIWWQGESHSNRTAAQHQALLEDLISNVRTYVNEPDLPVCLIQVDSRINATDVNGTNSVSSTQIQEIQQAQIDTADADNFVKVVATSSYINDMIYADNNNDNFFEAVHWNTAAHVPIGYVAAQQMYNLIEGITEWSPTESTDIVSWYDASDSQSITESSGAVSNWANKKSLGDFVQVIASQQPTLLTNKFTGEDAVQRPAIYFDRQNVERMNVTNGFFGPLTNSYEEISLFIVAKYPIHIQPQYSGVNANSALWGHSMGKSEYTSGFAHCPTGSDSKAITRVSSFGTNNTNDILSGNSSDFIIQDTPFIMEWKFSNTSGDFDLFVNGISQENKTLGSGWVSPYWVSGEFTLGTYNSGGFAPTTVEVAEVIACNSYLSQGERQKIEGYLAYKWGASLPSSHPYKGIHP